MPRFSLRFLLLIVIMCSICFGHVFSSARRQRQAVAWVQGQGGTVFYDFQFDARGRHIANAEPTVLLQWIPGLDVHFGHSVHAVAMTSTEVVDVRPIMEFAGLRRLKLDDTVVSDLEPLRGLANLEELYLANTRVTDLNPIGELAELKRLRLRWTRIDDVSALVRLRRLEQLDLRDTLVTEAQVLELQKAIPDCRILIGEQN